MAGEISGVQSDLWCKVPITVYETRLDARITPAQNAEPEERDDLLPIFPKRQFQPDLTELAATAALSAPVSLLVIDFDHVKSVNDEFGHIVGDEVLVGTASMIKDVGNQKGRCFRWGGDELAILLPNHTSEEALAVFGRIRQAVAAIKFPSYPKRATLRIDVASYPDSCDSVELLFRIADDAAIKAKKRGSRSNLGGSNCNSGIVASHEN
jgi:diguanylate cyclase (GGDEF)-like protein